VEGIYFFPEQQDAYNLLSHNHIVEAGGFVVSTTFWKRTVATNARRSQMTRNESAMNHEGHVRLCFGTATRRTAQHTQPVTYWILSTVDTLTVR
jgi:hypothetical protein